jgi:hypothetical protein
VEDDANEVGDNTLGLDDVCIRSTRDDVCTRSMRRERWLPSGGGSRLLLWAGDLGSMLRCTGLRSSGGEPHQC